MKSFEINNYKNEKYIRNPRRWTCWITSLNNDTEVKLFGQLIKIRNMYIYYEELGGNFYFEKILTGYKYN